MYNRQFRGLHICLIISGICVAVIGLPIYIFADTFVRLFTSDELAISYGIAMIQTMMPLYYCQALNQIYSNAVRGFGKSRAVMFLSLIGMIGCRQLWLAISMSVRYDVANIFIGYPVGWFFSALFVFVYYWFAIRKKYRVNRSAGAALNG